MCDLVRIAYMDLPPNCSPFDIIKEWILEAKENGVKRPIYNVATATKNGEVSNRSISYAEIQKDNYFYFLTDGRSRKSRHIAENPNVSVCLLLQYEKDEAAITRQICFEGRAETVPYEKTAKYFEHLPLYMKLKAHIITQGKDVDWDKQKQHLDTLLQECIKGLDLSMPQTMLGYRVYPKEIDFYCGMDHCIADRVIFNRCSEEKWCHRRVGA